MVNSFFKYKIMDLSTTLIKPSAVYSVLHNTLKKSAQIRQPIPKKTNDLWKLSGICELA